MSDFKDKIHKIQFLLELRPAPCWGTYSAAPDLIAVFKGPTFEGREREGESWEGKGVEGWTLELAVADVRRELG